MTIEPHVPPPGSTVAETERHPCHVAAMASSHVTDSPISATRVISYLNAHSVNYRVCSFSPSTSEDDVEREANRLGFGLVQAVPLDVVGQGIVLAIIPSSLAVHYAQLSSLVAPRLIRPLPLRDARERLALSDSTDTIPPLAALLGVESLLSPLIDQHRAIGFFIGSGNALITLGAPDFRRLVSHAAAVPVPTRARYRAYASPRRKAHQRAVLGVSLENADFRTAKLVTITDWIRRHYAHCVVMIGDGMNRITLQLDSAIPESEALERSKWLARDFAYSQSSVFGASDSACRFDLVFSSDIQNTPRYVTYYRELGALFNDNSAFQEAFSTFSRDFLRRKPCRQEHVAEHVNMSSTYLLEELAVISCLTEEAPCTFVYPGSLTILEEIADGKHPYVPTRLQQIDYVELKLKRL